jgi:hypothetical protein
LAQIGNALSLDPSLTIAKTAIDDVVVLQNESPERDRLETTLKARHVDQQCIGQCRGQGPPIEQQIAALGKLGIETGVPMKSPKVNVVMIKDPDGNSIAFAEALDSAMAH